MFQEDQLPHNFLIRTLVCTDGHCRRTYTAGAEWNLMSLRISLPISSWKLYKVSSILSVRIQFSQPYKRDMDHTSFKYGSGSRSAWQWVQVFFKTTHSPKDWGKRYVWLSSQFHPLPFLQQGSTTTRITNILLYPWGSPVVNQLLINGAHNFLWVFCLWHHNHFTFLRIAWGLVHFPDWRRGSGLSAAPWFSCWR